MARPMPTPETWINPCNIHIMVSTDSADPVDFRSEVAINAYTVIIQSSQEAKKYVVKIKDEFVTETCGEPDFMKEFDHISYDWLPKIPPPDSKPLDELEATDEDIRKALLDSFEYLQKFAVAVDQMVWDQVRHEGNFLEQFRTVEVKQKMPLCELQQTILMLQIPPNPDVTKEIISEEHRTIDEEATRNIRDYIILRDHAHALEYIAEMFSVLINKIQEGKT